MLTYDDIKVGTFINASGTVTTLGGSLMPEPVVEAMAQASRSFVGLDELHEEAGKWLAQKIGVPAAFIPCGAASGMLVAAAACLTGTDTDLIRALPEVPSGKNEFVISYVDEHTYVHQGFRVAGGVLVAAGTSAGVTSKELIGAITERTAAVVHFLGKQSKQQLIEVIAGAHERGVPVVVDAAAQLPPRSNLSEIVGLAPADPRHLQRRQGHSRSAGHRLGAGQTRPRGGGAAERQPAERDRTGHEGGQGRDHGAARGGRPLPGARRGGGTRRLGSADAHGGRGRPRP